MRIESLHLEGVGPFENTTIDFPKGTNPDLADVYLLVGQNGCGKTTALHAIAALLAPGAATKDLAVERRFRSTRQGRISIHGPSLNILAVRTGGGAIAAEEARETTQDGPFNGLVTLSKTPRPQAFEVWRDDLIDGGSFGPRAYGWAAFAYSGNRAFERGSVASLEEDLSPPLVGSLGFSVVDDSKKLANWVSAQQFKRLKALDSGQVERADQFRRSLDSIEAAVRRIIGTDFSFHSSIDDLNVRVRLNDDVVDFDLVPAGVKSIVSWIADLLMRMERIQWQSGLPSTEREFLLLLDEIDLHLHPAWQRKLLPAVQQLFPKAQIIASTHSPFVVASLADGAVIELKLDAKGRSTAQPPLSAPLELSYSATMRRLFGIDSDFDLETEKLLNEFQAVNERVMKGEAGAREELARRAGELLKHGEEVAQLVHFALKQTEKRSPRPTGT